MQDEILSLTDSKALSVASAFARAKMRGTEQEIRGDASLARAMANELLPRLGGVADVPSTKHPPTDGELARAALLLLADDPENREAIRALITGPQPEQFFGVELVAAVVAGLVVLQTRVKITRDKNGKYTFEIEKLPTKDGLLKDLVKALLPRIGT